MTWDDWKVLFILSCLAILLGTAVAALTGCNAPEVRPFTRIAYQEYAWLPQGDESERTQALYLMAGPSVSTPRIKAKIGIGANLTAPEGNWVAPGVLISPEAYIGLDDEFQQYFYLTTYLTRFEEGHEIYGYVSWEKTW